MVQRLVDFFEKSLEKLGVIDPIKGREGYMLSYISPDSFVDYMKTVTADLRPSDNQDILKALSNIRQAVAQNKESGDMQAGVNASDVDAVVAWTVNNTRLNMGGDLKTKRHGSLAEYSAAFNAKSLSGACGYCSSLAMLPLNDLGLEGKLPNVYNFEMKYGTSHAFAVVTAPVTNEAGVVEEKSYLVDASYKQFCVPFREEITADHCDKLSGFYLAQTKEGMDLLNDLLVKGYTELTPRKAKLYLDGFNKNLPVFEHEEEYITQMRSFHYDDYDRQEFVAWGANIDLPDLKGP